MVKKTVEKSKVNAEAVARRDLLEELYYDVYSSRTRVYKVNFFRGIFFGFGTALGGSIVVALIVWALSWLTDIPGGIGDFVQLIVDSVETSQ